MLSAGAKSAHQAAIGDGLYPSNDVDLYEVSLSAGQYLVADIDAGALDDGGSLSSLDSYLRVFDASGSQLASNDDGADPDTGITTYGDAALAFTASAAGAYYVGVSHWASRGYSPNTGGSGAVANPGDFARTGAYLIQLTVYNALPPVAPTGLTATAASASQIDLSWWTAAGATGYSLERSPNGTSGWSVVATPGADVTTYSDTGLTGGASLYYRVRAFNDGGASPYSSPAGAPRDPPCRTATAVSATRIDLIWVRHASDAWSTDVEQSPDGATGWTQVASLSGAAASYAATGPFAGSTAYSFRVRTNSGSSGYTAYSSVASVTTPAFPTAPTLSSAAPQSDSAVALSWTAAGATSYRVERSVASSGTWTAIALVPAGTTTYTDAGLREVSVFTYRVRTTPSSTPRRPGRRS